MISRSVVGQIRKLKAWQHSAFLGLAVALVPAYAQAQDFKDILFIERGIVGTTLKNVNIGGHDEYNGFHHVDEYFGHNGRKGGGLFILKDYQGAKQKVDVVAGLKVPDGKTNAGQTLSSGTFLSPDLSYDGKKIVFAWSSGGTEKWVAKNRFHIFTVDIDGKNLFQVTDGNYDDFHTAWMPNGRIVFMSTRRGGYGRCHGRQVPTYAMHSVKADGTDLIRLSSHETNEFHPSIGNDGRIIYTRWDYIDRDALAAHHIWFCNPDGSNPRSWGGNYSYPLDTMSGGPWTDGRKDGKRPQSEFYARSIPGSATKYVAVAGPHHGEAYGTIIIRDFSKVDDNRMGQVTKITPDNGMPETAENGDEVYGPVFPLSETQFITSSWNSMILLDTSVSPPKKTTLYTTADSNLRPIYGQPVMARTPPPIITEATYQGERWTPSVAPATVQIANVYTTDSYGKLPADAKIKSMRIVQVLSKTTPNANDPRLGFASQNVAKLSLGTVPVEEDGSVFFEAPIGKLILFHLLDDKGMAVQTMRSGTYLHPGENMTCTGCHEDKMAAPPIGGTPLASKRAASKMEPEAGRVEPINYARNIKPILTKCYACHAGKNGAPTDTSYAAQQNYAWWFAGDANGNTEAVHGGSRSKAGMVGARGSKMGKALLSTTHQQAQKDGKYTDVEFRTIVQWLDLGSDELGHFDNQNGQRSGQLVWPTLDLNKDDPQGLKYDCEGRACPTGGGAAGTGGSRSSSSAQGGSTGTVSGGTASSGSSSGGNSGSGGSKVTPSASSSNAGNSGGAGSIGGASSSKSGGNGGGGSSTSSSSKGGNTPASSGGQSANTSSKDNSGSSGSGGTSGKSSESPDSSIAKQSSGGGCNIATTPKTSMPILFLLGLAFVVTMRKNRRL
jgi:hypothetical protein